MMNGRWAVVPATEIRGGIVHVVPLDDLEDHHDDGLCPCSPTLQFDGDAKAIFHRAFDGREQPIIKSGSFAYNGISGGKT